MEKVIQILIETEMGGMTEKSRIKTKINKIRINEDVKFEWIKAGKNVKGTTLKVQGK